jgi:hypothetical protein
MSACGSRAFGSARVSRAGFGVAPKWSFLRRTLQLSEGAREVRDGEDAFASTRDARALPNSSGFRARS